MDPDWRPWCRMPRDLVRPVRIDPAGVDGPTRHQAEGPHWRGSTYGFHVPAGTDSTRVEQRILEQSMRVGTDGAVTGWAALRLRGAAFFDGLAADGRTLLPVPLICPRKLEDTAGSVASRVSLAGHRIWTAAGIPCVGAERAVLDEVNRLADLREGVVVVDMACAARITSLRRLHSYAERHRRRSGVLLAALDLADEHSLSPWETRMRLTRVLTAGWPHPQCNRDVYSTAGEFLGRPDLLDPETGVAGEYDGALHRSRARHRSDVDRLERFRRHDLEPFVMVAGDTPDVQLRRMAEARARAVGRQPGERRWTIEPPPGVRPPLTLDEELEARGWPAD